MRLREEGLHPSIGLEQVPEWLRQFLGCFRVVNVVCHVLHRAVIPPSRLVAAALVVTDHGHEQPVGDLALAVLLFQGLLDGFSGRIEVMGVEMGQGEHPAELGVFRHDIDRLFRQGDGFGLEFGVGVRPEREERREARDQSGMVGNEREPPAEGGFLLPVVLVPCHHAG